MLSDFVSNMSLHGFEFSGFLLSFIHGQMVSFIRMKPLKVSKLAAILDSLKEMLVLISGIFIMLVGCSLTI